METSQRLPVTAEHHDRLFDHHQPEVVLPHVVPHARDDHGQLRLLEIVEQVGVDLLRDFEGLLVTAQSALAIGLDSTMHIQARQTPRGTDLAKRLGVVPGQVCGDSC